ncbi:ROK family protein [bacterium]|nr:ROK family protein [bacterium]
MNVIGSDLGGTKLSSALFAPEGTILYKISDILDGREGKDVCRLIHDHIRNLLSESDTPVSSIGISVPGIYREKTGSVWAPNIPGWTDYPLRDDLIDLIGDTSIRITIDSDRSCYILGETWKGAARGCSDVVFIAVGTGIGAGVMVNGAVVRGNSGCAGSIGWFALDRPYKNDYERSGSFEYHTSGEGIAGKVRSLLSSDTAYTGILREKDYAAITTRDVFDAYASHDPLAVMVLDESVELWGMAAANMISLLNPEMIVFGGGVFGPAGQFIDRIRDEARKWAQPVGCCDVRFTVSKLGPDAGLYGAGRLALLKEGEY